MYKILWLTYVASPYKKKLFIELSKLVDLTVLLVDKKENNRNDEWVFNDDSLKVIRINDDYKDIINQQVKCNDILLDSMYITKQGKYATKVFNKNNKVTIMHADGGIPKNRGKIINKLMSLAMLKHNYFLSSSKYTDMYYNYYGVKENRYNYRFTSLTKEDMERHKQMSNNKNKYREGLGINRYTFLSVGQPIKRKGYDILVKAIKDIKDKDFIVVGGTPMKEVSDYVKQNNIDNIKFIGLINSKELEKYYAACDAFILPTREDIWGLVINEALSFNLPVITSDNCVAGLNFKDNCVIVKNEDINGYKEAINTIKPNNNYDCVKDYTIENSALDIYAAINEIERKISNE